MNNVGGLNLCNVGLVNRSIALFPWYFVHVQYDQSINSTFSFICQVKFSKEMNNAY